MIYKTFTAFLLIFTMNGLFANEFIVFLRQVNQDNENALKAFDQQAKKKGVQNFKQQYLTELSKELFSSDIYVMKKNYIVSKESFHSEKETVRKKTPKKYLYLVGQLIDDIEEFIESNQYSSLEKFNNYPTSRLTKQVRANLKKVRLISKVWNFLNKTSEQGMTDFFEKIIKKAQKRVLLMASITDTLPENYKLSIFLEQKPKKASDHNLEEKLNKPIEEIIRAEDSHLKDPPSKKDSIIAKKPNKDQWAPKEDPSYLSLLNLFLNTGSQSKAKQAKYIAPKTLPKPSNDW